MANPDVKTFIALAEDTAEADLAPIPFRLEGRLMNPIAATTVPDEVAEQIRRWDRVSKADRKRLLAEYELVTTWSMDLEALAEAPTGILDDLMRSVVTDDRGRQTYNAMSLNRFMFGALLDEHVEKFAELVRDKNRLLPIDTLGDVVTWLAKEMTGRPSRPSSD